jgi:hypothetical protein
MLSLGENVNYDKIRKAALDKANQVRKRLGKPPVDHLYKGTPNNAFDCPITNTIFADDISRDDYAIQTGYHSISVYDPKSDHLLVNPILEIKQNRLSKDFLSIFDVWIMTIVPHPLDDLIA